MVVIDMATKFCTKIIKINENKTQIKKNIWIKTEIQLFNNKINNEQTKGT